MAAPGRGPPVLPAPHPVAEIDDRERRLSSDESGGPIRSWRHDIIVEPLDGGRCRYTDVIHIDAGALTTSVVAFARLFYRERQRRWRSIAPVLAGVDRRRRAGAVDSADGVRRVSLGR